MRRLLLPLAALLLVSVVVATITVWRSLLAPGDHAETEMVIEPGTPAVLVLERLYEKGLIPSVLAARVYLEVIEKGREPRFGHYRFEAETRPVDILEQLLDGAAETIEVTIVEGLDAEEVAERYVHAGLGDHHGWQEVLGQTEWVADIAPEAPSLEGFLFPETYRFSRGTTARSVARHMVERFVRVWLEEATASPDPWGSVLDVVTLASLVEAETALSDERPRVAGVFLNRLDRGMLLQCDPTVVFALKRAGAWEGRLLRLHWQLDHPYNTYRYPGLPPGPICSPGRAALRAALGPELSDELYFVAKPGGGHTFSRTLREHNRAVARLKRSRR